MGKDIEKKGQFPISMMFLNNKCKMPFDISIYRGSKKKIKEEI